MRAVSSRSTTNANTRHTNAYDSRCSHSSRRYATPLHVRGIDESRIRCTYTSAREYRPVESVSPEGRRQKQRRRFRVRIAIVRVIDRKRAIRPMQTRSLDAEKFYRCSTIDDYTDDGLYCPSEITSLSAYSVHGFPFTNPTGSYLPDFTIRRTQYSTPACSSGT